MVFLIIAKYRALATNFAVPDCSRDGLQCGPRKYAPQANIQFVSDWLELSNPGLQANQWGLYIWAGCIFPWSATS